MAAWFQVLANGSSWCSVVILHTVWIETLGKGQRVCDAGGLSVVITLRVMHHKERDDYTENQLHRSA
jgi:hypothetical protein